jgi:hypothetical protein
MARNTHRENEEADSRPLVLLWSEPGGRASPHMRITSISEQVVGEGRYTY